MAGIWLRVRTLDTRWPGQLAAMHPGHRSMLSWGEVRPQRWPCEKARTLDEPIIAASASLFRFGASAARLARSGVRRCAVRRDAEGPLQIGAEAVHEPRPDHRMLPSSSAKAFRKASRCSGWMGAAAAWTAANSVSDRLSGMRGTMAPGVLQLKRRGFCRCKTLQHGWRI
jgi:hypothetical protein